MFELYIKINLLDYYLRYIISDGKLKNKRYYNGHGLKFRIYILCLKLKSIEKVTN